jgi:hypothetical protein
MTSRGTLILVVVALIIVGVGGMALRRAVDKPTLSFSESELHALEGKIEGLEASDLEGLSSSAASMSFGEQELDDLGSVIDGLSFDDLEGLTTP